MIETISDYATAKDFVSAWIEHKQSKRTGFSMRQLCARLELKSPNYLKLILDGKRSLTIDLGLKLSNLMALDARQKNYFLSMIEAESAASDHESELAERKVLRGRRHLKTEIFNEDRRELVSRWHHLLVRELTFLSDFDFSPDYVVKKLNGQISRDEAARSLELLVEHGLIAKKPRGDTETRDRDSRDRWYSTDKVLDTGNETFAREAMLEHHSETLKVWSEGLANLNPDEQELGLLHIPISSEKLPELRRRIQQFQDELIGWLMTEDKPDRVVQVGTYLIPFKRS